MSGDYTDVSQQRPRRRWYASRWFVAVLAFVLGVAVGSSGDDGQQDTTDRVSSTSTQSRSPEPAQPQATVTATATSTGEATPQNTARPTAKPGVRRPANTDAAKRRRAASRPSPKRRTPRAAKRYAVLDVVDGDTVKVGYAGGVSVRVIGIDAPESVHPGQPDECWGQAAADAARRMLSGKQVRLVFDPSQGRTDSYGRTLAYLHAPGVGDFGLAMVRQGHAAEYTYDSPYRRQLAYRNAESRARNLNRGLWRSCGGPDVPLTSQPAPSPKPTPEARPEQPRPIVGGGCASEYEPCIPPYPPDLDCGDLDGPIRVTGEDPHGLDRDRDGVACE